MVEFRREDDASGPVVTGFTANGFKIGEARYASGLMLTPEDAFAWTSPGILALTADELAPVLGLNPLPEFLLLGTGTGLVQPPRSFVNAVEALGMGVEVMDSKAAARSWGILRSEGRWMVAALMAL